MILNIRVTQSSDSRVRLSRGAFPGSGRRAIELDLDPVPTGHLRAVDDHDRSGAATAAEHPGGEPRCHLDWDMPKHITTGDVDPHRHRLLGVECGGIGHQQQPIASLQSFDDDRAGSENRAVHVRSVTQFFRWGG